MNRPYGHVLSARRRAMIELMFEKHRYTQEDVDDFFDKDTMDKRFGEELKRIREARAKRKTEPILKICQFERCTD